MKAKGNAIIKEAQQSAREHKAPLKGAILWTWERQLNVDFFPHSVHWLLVSSQEGKIVQPGGVGRSDYSGGSIGRGYLINLKNKA